MNNQETHDEWLLQPTVWIGPIMLTLSNQDQIIKDHFNKDQR